MRKLATIRTVKKLVPIKGADFIELAIVDGWQCVVKKGEFTEGDKGIYFEIDSVKDSCNPISSSMISVAPVVLTIKTI